MPTRYIGLIPAAGSGARFGGELPKQYQPLLGRAMLAHTVDALAKATPLHRIYVIHALDDINKAFDLMHEGKSIRSVILF